MRTDILTDWWRTLNKLKTNQSAQHLAALARKQVAQLRQRNCASSAILRKLNLIKKNKKSLFEPPLWGLRGNVCNLSIARCKARGQLPICHNWTFFTISYGWDVISRNLSKSVFLQAGESMWVQVSDERGRHPPTTVGVRQEALLMQRNHVSTLLVEIM